MWSRYKGAGGAGAGAAAALGRAKDKAAASKQATATAGKEVNSCKARIDALTASGSAADAATLPEAKLLYRGAHARYTAAKAEADRQAAAADALAAELVAGFERWLVQQGMLPASSGGGMGMDGGDAAGDMAAFLSGTGTGTGTGASAGINYLGLGGAGEEPLDEGEAFERMERERVRKSEPDSLAFFNATRLLRQTGGPAARSRSPRGY